MLNYVKNHLQIYLYHLDLQIHLNYIHILSIHYFQYLLFHLINQMQ